MCGDSLNDTAKLMDGTVADMVFTDPPYNVAYGSSKNPIWGSKWNGNEEDGVILNDKMGADAWVDFCKGIATSLRLVTNGPIYACHAPGPDGMKMTLAFIESGIHWSSTLILYKDRLVPGRSDYQKRYEACFYGWFEGDKIEHLKDRTQVDVWEYKRPNTNDVHPTMKPLELMAKAIHNHPEAKTVVDLFLGSGSTLIACEQTDRTCYGMELDPKYVDVIRKRYAKFIQPDNQLPENWEELTPAISAKEQRNA
jgi:DNA modification methylase